MQDPNNNLISEWSGVRSIDDSGVFQGEMPTSPHPPLGTWTIAVTVNVRIKTHTVKSPAVVHGDGGCFIACENFWGGWTSNSPPAHFILIFS